MYSEAVKSAFPFYWGPYDGISTLALFFWLFLIIFTILFFFGQVAAIRTRRNEISILGNQTKELGKILRTLPSKDFLHQFAIIYELSYVAGQKPFYNDEYKNDEITHAIRVVLDGVVALTEYFDGEPKKDFFIDGNRIKLIYAANIMLYKQSSSLSSTEKDEYIKNIKFCEDEISISELEGVLILQKQMSTTTETDKPTPDDGLGEVILPIPKNIKSKDKERYRILPGAPLAYVERDMNIYRNTKSLGQWCREKGDFSPSVCNAVDDYFNSNVGKNIRSFVSIPLYLSATDDKCIGVLNIHRNIEGMLNSKENAEFFRPLIHPFVCLLKELIDSLEYENKV